MAEGVLGLLKHIFTEKRSELDRDYHEKTKMVEKDFLRNPRYRQMERAIQALQQKIDRMKEDLGKLEEQKHKDFPQGWAAKERAERLLREDYLDLRVKATLNGMPRDEVKKMIKVFREKDYFRAVTGG